MTKKKENICEICGTRISKDEAYQHALKTMCESCCLDIRACRARKTHWQYLGSIKAGYLIPGSKTNR